MQINIYLLLAFCGLTYVQGYTIPNIKVDILARGFRVSIPDEGGILKVLYTIEINGMCPAIMEYVITVKDGFWSTTYNKFQLSPTDRLTIFLLVKHSSEVYKTTEIIEIDNDLKPQSVKSGDVISISKEIERNSCETVSKNPDCIRSKTVLANAESRPCEGDLLFHESFEEDGILNKYRWSHDVRISLDSCNEEFALFDNNEVNNFIESGVFNIVPTIQKDIRRGTIDLGSRCTAFIARRRSCNRTASPNQKVYLPPVHSTVVHTKYSFKFGRVEVRAQLPKGDWILPYIMLQESTKLVDACDANQIRIAFAHGNIQLMTSRNEEIGGSKLYGGIYHKSNLSNVEDVRDQTNDKHWGDDYHIYELIWTPTQISLGVDGKIYGEIDKTVDVEHFIVLGVSVGGHKEFGNDVTKPWMNTDVRAVLTFFNNPNWKNTWTGSETLKVDYVRVYAL